MFPRHLSKFGLGTAQFGMSYGRFRDSDRQNNQGVEQTLELARQFGFSMLDTAQGYGNAEDVLGTLRDLTQSFQIITKTSAFGPGQITDSHRSMLLEKIRSSLARLGCSSIYGVLIHRTDDLLQPGAEHLFDGLCEAKSQGIVEKIGVSVYTDDEIDRIFSRFDLDIVQLPINVLDRRLIEAGSLKELDRRGVEVHARSALLQGLLAANPAFLPPDFAAIRPVLSGFREAASNAGMTPPQAALMYLRSIPEIHRILIGVDSREQLFETFGNLPDTCDINFDPFRINDPQILNPDNWRP